MSRTLSVVMPVHNEALHLAETIDSLLQALAPSDFDAELVLVDDGSTDASADVVRGSAAGRLPLTVLSQPNRGRFEARRAGIEAATGEWILLLDGRVRLDPDALAFVGDRLDEADAIWNGHVDVDTGDSLYGAFWKLIAELAWSDYFADPRETSFGADEFDRYPKGTTCFLAQRALLLEAVGAFRSRYGDLRDANDDTPLLRWIANRGRIHLSPRFRCAYTPRTTLRAFLRHSVRRGVVFVDGHARPESRFFPAAVAFYPVSAALALVSLRRPSIIVVTATATSLAATAFGISRSRSPHEIAALGLLSPVYGAAHGIGMWVGLAKLVKATAVPAGPAADDVPR